MRIFWKDTAIFDSTGSGMVPSRNSVWSARAILRRFRMPVMPMRQVTRVAIATPATSLALELAKLPPTTLYRSRGGITLAAAAGVLSENGGEDEQEPKQAEKINPRLPP